MAPRAKAKAQAGSEHEAQSTTDHDTIRRWAEARCGRPSTVKGTSEGGEHAGILRIDFPGYSGLESLQEITWEDFFAKFDEANLAFLYQDEAADGELSRFCKFVARATADSKTKPAAKSSPRKAAKPKASARSSSASATTTKAAKSSAAKSTPKAAAKPKAGAKSSRRKSGSKS